MKKTISILACGAMMMTSSCIKEAMKDPAKADETAECYACMALHEIGYLTDPTKDHLESIENNCGSDCVSLLYQ